MKKKFFKKDRKIKKSKTPKNAKKLISKKKAARRPVAPVVGPPITLGFESSASAPIEPEALADSAHEAQEPTPDVEVPA